MHLKRQKKKYLKIIKIKRHGLKNVSANLCNAGTFSSDRTIKQYADEIWDVKRTENK